MIVVTTNEVAGQGITGVFGLVRGSSVRTKHLGKDIIARLRNIAGGEIYEYTKVLAQAREQAVDRMIEEAQLLGANAVVAVRFEAAQVMTGAAEMLCYGTAVRIESTGDTSEDAHTGA